MRAAQLINYGSRGCITIYNRCATAPSRNGRGSNQSICLPLGSTRLTLSYAKA